MKYFDIFCMSETKTKKGVPITNYTCFDLDPVKKTDKHKLPKYPGIHGLTVYIKDYLAVNCQLVNNEELQCKSVIWIKIPDNFILGAVYLPHERSDYHYNDLFEDLTSDIELIKDHNLPILLMGDFNSRTGTLNDINILDDSDILELYKFPNILNLLEESNIPFARKNLDKSTNNNGNRLINMCKFSEICIVNGRVGYDKLVGSFTLDNTSTIDYAICSPDLLSCITDFKVDIFDPLLSDKHNPICITINTVRDKKQPDKPSENIPESNSSFIKCKWDKDKKDDYEKSFDMNKINNFILKLSQINPHDITHSTMDCIAKELKEILLEPANTTGMRKVVKIKSANSRQKPNKPWFNLQCKMSMKNYKRIKKRLARPPTENEVVNLKAVAKKHRTLTRKVRRKYYIDLNNKLKTLKTKNPGEYWHILNQGKNTVKPSKIPLANLYQHFSLLSADQKPPKKQVQEPQNRQINKDINVIFTLEELRMHINKLKNNKKTWL